MNPCSCCFTDTLGKCETEIKLNIVLPVYGVYRWVITDKFGNKYQGALNDERTIPVEDLPPGLLTQYGGTLSLQIFEAGSEACAPEKFLVAGKYDCIEFDITGGTFEKNNLGCEVTPTLSAIQDNEYVALLTIEGTGDPVATVVFNELGGPIVWARTALGVYTATSTGLFVPGRTFISGLLSTTSHVITANVITFNNGGSDISLTDEYIKIEVYP